MKSSHLSLDVMRRETQDPFDFPILSIVGYRSSISYDRGISIFPYGFELKRKIGGLATRQSANWLIN